MKNYLIWNLSMKRPADKNAISKIAFWAWLIWPIRVKGQRSSFFHGLCPPWPPTSKKKIGACPPQNRERSDPCSSTTAITLQHHSTTCYWISIGCQLHSFYRNTDYCGGRWRVIAEGDCVECWIHVGYMLDTCWMSSSMYPTCIQHVSNMYPTSSMYPACIQHPPQWPSNTHRNHPTSTAIISIIGIQ